MYKEKQYCDTKPPTIEEIKKYLKKAKRRKAPGLGPHPEEEIPIEFIKELDDDNLEIIRTCLEQWWEDEHIPDEFLEARVALIYKKRRHL